MYPYYQYQPPYEQHISQGAGHPSIKKEGKQKHHSSSTSIGRQCDKINEQANVISSEELTGILDSFFTQIEKLHNQNKQIDNLKDIIAVLIHLRQPVLDSIVQHRFFTLLPIPLNHIIQQWNKNSTLNENNGIIFRNLTKLLTKLFRELTEFRQYPFWFTDASLLDTTGVCLTNLSKSGKYFEKSNGRTMKIFIRLFDIYEEYQYLLSTETNVDQEKLGRLIDPLVQCLSSSFYIDSFDNIEKGASLRSKQEKFFLTRCPKFLISYNGSRLEEIMNKLLLTMLPEYTQILKHAISSVHQWKNPMIRAVNHLLQIVNHGSVNPNILSTHLSLIDHVLTIIDVPIFYNNIQNQSTHPETSLINTAVNLLVNYVGEPTVLAHIKQKKVTSSFMRLTSAKYGPLVDNIYTLLAFTTSEDDIKSMQNPGTLLSTVVNGLKAEIGAKTINQDRVVQLIETLQGLAQHDQLKEEILKQNIHEFLLQSMNKLPQAAITPLLITFWSLSFAPDAAAALRTNTELLEKIQTISKATQDEGLKKAADGLVWKLIREPAMLNKIAEEEAADETAVTTEVVIGEDGKEKIVTTTKKVGAGAQIERTFAYDIMISYCHADKELIIKLHKFLVDEGFKVWIDLDNMFGPAMSAMADAVENSEFVLLSMSESYKQSTYCQAEAEYAFGCKRRLVPLIVRPGYKADGWLGFMIGSRIYIDFGFFDFETACDKLLHEMARQRQRPLPSKAGAAAPAPAPAPITTAPDKTEAPVDNDKLFSQKLPGPYTKREAKSHYDTMPIEYWSESDVLDFFYNHQLNELMPLCEKMNGLALIQLYKMCASRHNRTYTILNDQLKAMYQLILPISTYTRFLSTIEQMIPPISQFIQPPPPQYMLPQPPPRLMLPPPVHFEPPISDSNSSYDIVITSNAPVSQMLQMVERSGAHWQMKNSRPY